MADKPKALRSAAYPAITLEEALKRLENLKTRLGLNGSFNRETVATGIGYRSVSGASARSVAALVHYGLLDRDKDNYTISEIGTNWLLPSDDHVRPRIEKEAAVKPKLFYQLFSEYNGQVLPKLLSNRLVTQYSIQSNVASEVVKLFRDTLRFAGLLDDNDVVISESQTPPKQSAKDTDRKADPPPIFQIDSQSRSDKADEPLATDQGVHHTGEGWELTVSLKAVNRLPSAAREKLRALMKAADDLTDELEA